MQRCSSADLEMFSKVELMQQVVHLQNYVSHQGANMKQSNLAMLALDSDVAHLLAGPRTQMRCGKISQCQLCPGMLHRCAEGLHASIKQYQILAHDWSILLMIRQLACGVGLRV